jgi:hypothetical protein
MEQKKMELPLAEEINYWKTSSSSPDKWLEKAAEQIEKLGGKVLTYAFGNDPEINRQAYLMQFKIGDDDFKVIWPVLPTRSDRDSLAAKRQAATLLYHDIKNKCLNARIRGHRRAFFEYYMLPDGRTAPDASFKELKQGLPQQLLEMRS